MRANVQQAVFWTQDGSVDSEDRVALSPIQHLTGDLVRMRGLEQRRVQLQRQARLMI